MLPGPEAYVSPSLYPTKARNPRVVPTWNYVAVHAAGPVEVFDDPARLRRVVERLTARLRSDPAVRTKLKTAEAAVADGKLAPTLAVEQIAALIEH